LMMDDPSITMEEYIKLQAEKAQRRDYPAIVYNDALTSNENISSEPTVSNYDAIKTDFDFSISFSDSKDEDYTFICNKDSFSYKLIPVNDLKPELILKELRLMKIIRTNGINEVDEPWSENRVTYEICDHICEPFHFKNGKAKWATCNSNNEGFCNGGELPGMAVPAPVQAPQPPSAATPTRTMAQRLSRLEEEVHSLCGDMGE
ncbi:hypothetical protein Tco_1139968, partial [Tanacetum coccineum]